MKNNILRVFLGGDIFGSVGMRCIAALLPSFIASEEIDFTVINAENATSGIGVSEEDARSVISSGADVITGGNHTFEKREFWDALSSMNEMLRPANYPVDANLPGRGAALFEKHGIKFGVINLQGREDMMPIDCPFHFADAQIAAWAKEADPPLVFVDFHAESNQEKEAMGLYLAGRTVSVTGTHTHVQTADERILPGGTAYMTDLGMTGALRSVIGMDPALAIKRNITQVLYRMEPNDAKGALRGLIIDIDIISRTAVALRRVELSE